MKSQGAGEDWRLDGDIVTVTIPMAWKRRGGRKVIVAPDGADAWRTAKPRRDETLIRALARAHRWKRMLEEGRFQSMQRPAGGGEDQPRPRLPAAQPNPSSRLRSLKPCSMADSPRA